MGLLTKAQLHKYSNDGYLVLEDALSESQLHLLHEEADILTNYLLSEGYDLSRDLGCIVEPLTCGYLDQPDNNDYKYRVSAYKARRDAISQTDVSHIVLETVSAWAAQLLKKDTVYVFNEQYIIKPPRSATHSQFAWHRDSDYLKREQQEEETIACWIALDDMSQKNGTLLVRPLGQGGNNQDEWVETRAGSIVFMSNRLLHKSIGNPSSQFRRAYMPQYSAKPFGSVGLAVECCIIKTAAKHS
ncbi:hypothetical protein BCR43DRAFT_496615 [Syncephalastrum racemosum]|uniref:Phytanoyl-CoA dioxygenase n=1 Tax=Syncephalastrum racemosum TaxID=13706 RepID=A0A1X2H4G0_SYNRA|nr:hypothetical protein BCR43DRAFT_496615 [Syncephalastrum racemosum]